jgi:hypothetical protein
VGPVGPGTVHPSHFLPPTSGANTPPTVFALSARTPAECSSMGAFLLHRIWATTTSDGGLPSRRLRRMFPYGTQRAAQVDEGGTVQVQRRHGGPAGGGAPLDEQEVGTPGEMARPALAARVEQGNGSPALRIAGMRFGVLVTVARRARPGQFGRCAARTAHPRHDVFADEGGTREVGGMPAVLATVTGAVAHLPPDCPRNGFTRPPRSLRGRVQPSPPARIGPGGEPVPPELRPGWRRSAGLPGPGTGSRPTPSESAGRVRSGR